MNVCFVCSVALLFFVHNVFSYGYTSCKTPTIKYGRIRSRQRGRAVRFLCNSGFELVGEKMAFCINGTWDVAIPRCVRGTCSKKDISVPNGIVLPSNNGGVLNFYCRQGYELNGPAAVYCDGFTWDSHRPSCLPSSTEPPLFCDFESEDLCHWTHDLNHDMDWVRDSYKTPTGYSMPTGPSHDHTKGNGSNGHYMYIESSSRRMNDTARLISPIFGKLNGSVCLEFWYHMYGKTIGTLRAYVRKISDPWPPKPSSAVFSKSGNQGNVWYRELIDLGPIPEQFQIIMEGVRGNGYVSDIAIDDVNIIPNCVYEDHLQTTTEFIPPETEVFRTIESCENRCGLKALANESTQQMIACDCDDYCYENSRCCPDYIDVCFSSTSTIDWSTTPEAELDKTEEVPNNSSVPKIRVAIPTTAKITPSTSKTTVKPTISSTTKTTARTTKVSKTTARTTKITKPVTKYTKVPLKVSTTPTLIILQPPTTPEIIQRMGPKVLLPSKNISKITFVKPKIPLTYKDDFKVPTQAGDDELLLTSPLPLEEDNNDINDASVQDQEDFVEKISFEKDYPFKINDVNSEHIGEIKTEFKQVHEPTSKTKVAFIAIATLIGIAVLGVVIGIALVKFRFVRLRNRRMTSGQGDSQSDVRFLTADEVLDFNLDKDYDDL